MNPPRDPHDDAEATDGGSFVFDGDSGAGRQFLGREALLARVTALLQSCEGCEKVAVIGITHTAPDEGGCNWSSTLVLEPAGVTPEVYTLAYAGVIGMARASWNLA